MLEARVGKDFGLPWDNLRLYVREIHEAGGVRRVAWPTNKLEFKLADEREAGVEHTPVAMLDATGAQQLMDDLWRCGVRPSEGTGSAGAFAAQGRHLEDLRSIVAKNLDVFLK